MCLVTPARVVAVDGPVAVVEVDGRQRRASLLVEPDVQVGDWVVIGSGTVLRRLDPTDADELIELLGGPGPQPATASIGGPR